MKNIEFIKKKERLLAIIIRDSYTCEGVEFLTPEDFSQQVAYMHHPAGKAIDAHVHNPAHRNVFLTQELAAKVKIASTAKVGKLKRVDTGTVLQHIYKKGKAARRFL